MYDTAVAAPNPAERGATGEPFETRPDAVHRYGYVVLASLGALGALVGLARGDVEGTRFLLMLAACVAVGLFGWWRSRDRLVVSATGVRVDHGDEVTWQQVASYRYRNASPRWSPTDLGELLVWPFVVLFRWVVYLPVRAVYRWVRYRRRDRRFLDGELVLLDAAGKPLVTIKGEDRYENVAEALDRILAALHDLPLPPFTLGVLELDAIAEIEIDGETTRIRTARGETEAETANLPNPFLVLEAVATRGGRIHLAGDVFVPASLRKKLT